MEDSVLQENSDDHEEDMITIFPPPQFASHLGIEKMMNNSSLKFFGSFFGDSIVIPLALKIMKSFGNPRTTSLKKKGLL